MAAQPVLHPSADALRAFALGKLNDTSAAALIKHLDSCPACGKVVAEVSGDDFLARLRQAYSRSSTPSPANALSESAVEVKPSASAHAIPNLPPELASNPQFEIARELGRGGMGVVYLAKNKLMERLEVLKVVNKTLLDHPGAVERFLREIRSAAKLNHANVVMAYSALQMGELLVFAMEYVEGEDLASLVKAHGPLPIQHACFYAQQTALGLQHAFEKSMVHRDIKPQNLILTREDKKHIVKVLDFGLAKVMREKKEDTGLTGEGRMLGSPDYIAPEQTLDAAKADIRADIYSLGCTLYYLLSGHPPFSAGSVAAVLVAHQLHEAKPLNLVRPDVPEDLAAVVRKMMAKSPAQRYQTPREVAQALLPFVKASAKPDAKSSSPPVVPSPERGSVSGAEARQTKKVLREAPGEGLSENVREKEESSSIAHLPDAELPRRKTSRRGKARSASVNDSFSLPGALRRFGRKGCVLTAAVSVSLALTLMLTTGYFVIKKLKKLDDTIIAGNQGDNKAGSGTHPGEPPLSPQNPPQPGGGGTIGNSPAQFPGPGIPQFPWLPGRGPFVPPSDAVVLDISGVADANTREAISEEMKALAQAARLNSWNTSQGDSMRVSLWPVNDVQAFARKLDFGTVNVNDRTITMRVHDEQWPLARASVVTKALNQLKLPNAHKRHVALVKLRNSLLDERRAEVVAALESLLDDADFITRKLAIKALSVWGNEKVVPILLEAMQDKVTRGEAMQALGRLKDERAAEPIAQRLEDISDLHEAAEALKQMGPVAEKAVLARLHHHQLLVRITVCDILGAIGTQQSIPLLEKVAAAGKDIRAGQDHIVAMKAVEAIVAIKARLGNANSGVQAPQPGKAPASPAGEITDVAAKLSAPESKKPVEQAKPRAQSPLGKSIRVEEDEETRSKKQSRKVIRVPYEEDNKTKSRTERPAESVSSGDLAQLTARATHPALKALLRSLVIPHDRVLFKPSSVTISGERSQREEKIVPTPFYVGNDPGQFRRERFRWIPYTLDWQQCKPFEPIVENLKSVRAYEEIAQDHVRSFLHENYDRRDKDDPLYLSRYDMLKAAGQVLSAVVRWHESAIQTGKREGKEWDNVGKRLRKQLNGVFLEQMKERCRVEGLFPFGLR